MPDRGGGRQQECRAALPADATGADRGVGTPVTIADAGWLQQLWEQAAAGIGHPPVFLEREWEQVILAQGLREPDAYLSARRHGRSTPLRPEQRLPRARGPQPAWRFC